MENKAYEAKSKFILNNILVKSSLNIMAPRIPIRYQLRINKVPSTQIYFILLNCNDKEFFDL